jgi:O-methyltransferase
VTVPGAARKVVVWAARKLGYDVWRVPTRARGRQWRDSEYYRPFFSPWLGYGEFAKYMELATPLSVVSPDRLYVLYVMLCNASQLEGEAWECGVYKGGTARMFAAILRARHDDRTLRLFDSFAGLPEVDASRDLLRTGAFGNVTVDSVRRAVGDGAINFHVGLIPSTFAGLEKSLIAFAHVDVDIYDSIRDCCNFIYPRMVAGGVMVFDDYGAQTTPGVRAAVDEYFADKPETPLVLASSQAIVVKAGGARR